MQKLVLTGSNGFLGTHFDRLLHKHYHIVGIYNTEKNDSIQESYKVDIANTAELVHAIEKIQPNIIVHTAAISSIAACEKEETSSYAINVDASVQLAALAKKTKAVFIFCSTDLVFDGKKGHYKEEEIPNPINKYGEQKYIAEQKIREANAGAIIVRLPLMIGENRKGFAGVVAEMKYCHEQKKKLFLFTNEYRTPALVEDVVKGIQILIEKKVTGIYHLAGRQKLNRLQIAQYVKAKYALNDVELLTTTHFEKNITNRPEDVSLEINKIERLGFQPDLFHFF
jgi:dTDP-4-dehydrorhamnose reductase